MVLTPLKMTDADTTDPSVHRYHKHYESVFGHISHSTSSGETLFNSAPTTAASTGGVSARRRRSPLPWGAGGPSGRNSPSASHHQGGTEEEVRLEDIDRFLSTPLRLATESDTAVSASSLLTALGRTLPVPPTTPQPPSAPTLPPQHRQDTADTAPAGRRVQTQRVGSRPMFAADVLPTPPRATPSPDKRAAVGARPAVFVTGAANNGGANSGGANSNGASWDPINVALRRNGFLGMALSPRDGRPAMIAVHAKMMEIIDQVRSVFGWLVLLTVWVTGIGQCLGRWCCC